jgi:hypothetical protein
LEKITFNAKKRANLNIGTGTFFKNFNSQNCTGIQLESSVIFCLFETKITLGKVVGLTGALSGLVSLGLGSIAAGLVFTWPPPPPPTGTLTTGSFFTETIGGFSGLGNTFLDLVKVFSLY